MAAYKVPNVHIFGNFKPDPEKRKRRKSPKEKRPGNDPAYLALIRKLPCCVQDEECCGNIEAHHLKATGERGAGMRSSDKWAVPLCHEHHINGVERIGSRKEISWFRERGIWPISLAKDLWANRHDLRAMECVLGEHRIKT